MKKIILSFLLSLCVTFTYGQTDQIYISVVLPGRSEFPAEASKQLERKLTQLLTLNGISSQDTKNRFVITAKADITSKDIVATTPQRVSAKIDLTILLGDAVENKVFETITLPLIGIGINENKAFIAAINQVKPQIAELSEFLCKAKSKIVDYYAVRCSQIIQQAHKLAIGNDYDEAIYQLMQIPDVCDCSKESQKLLMEFAIKRNDNVAAQLYNEARARWAASPTSDGASVVADIIARIPINSSSQSNVNSLINTINKKLRDDEKRQWAFKIKQYCDAQEKEHREFQMRVDQQMADNRIREKRIEADVQRHKFETEAKLRQQAEEQTTRRIWIDAAKSIGLGFVNNLPKTMYRVKNIMSW